MRELVTNQINAIETLEKILIEEMVYPWASAGTERSSLRGSSRHVLRRVGQGVTRKIVRHMPGASQVPCLSTMAIVDESSWAMSLLVCAIVQNRPDVTRSHSLRALNPSQANLGSKSRPQAQTVLLVHDSGSLPKRILAGIQQSDCQVKN